MTDARSSQKPRRRNRDILTRFNISDRFNSSSISANIALDSCNMRAKLPRLTYPVTEGFMSNLDLVLQ